MRDKLQIVSSKPRDRLDQLSDDELMVLVAADHRPPFEQLVRRHHPVVLGYATRFLGDQTLGREVTQEVFLTVWQERTRYRPQGKFRSYLLSVAFNRCQAVARRRKTRSGKQPQLAPPGDAEQAGPLDNLIEAEKAAFVRRELLQLNDRTRQAIILRFCSGLTYDQISAATGKRPGTIKSQVCRGIKQLLGRLPVEYRS